MSLGPHHPPGGFGYLLFELRTQVCVSCAAPGAMRIAGDRRAICPPSAGPPTATPAALERHLSAPALAHRCAMVTIMPGTVAADPRLAVSGHQQPQQRAARRAAAGLVAGSSRRGQPRSSLRRPQQRPGGGACAAHTPQGGWGPGPWSPAPLGHVQRRFRWPVGSALRAGREPCSHLPGGCTARFRVQVACLVLFYTSGIIMHRSPPAGA